MKVATVADVIPTMVILSYKKQKITSNGKVTDVSIDII